MQPRARQATRAEEGEVQQKQGESLGAERQGLAFPPTARPQARVRGRGMRRPRLNRAAAWAAVESERGARAIVAPLQATMRRGVS